MQNQMTKPTIRMYDDYELKVKKKYPIERIITLLFGFHRDFRSNILSLLDTIQKQEYAEKEDDINFTVDKLATILTRILLWLYAIEINLIEIKKMDAAQLLDIEGNGFFEENEYKKEDVQNLLDLVMNRSTFSSYVTSENNAEEKEKSFLLKLREDSKDHLRNIHNFPGLIDCIEQNRNKRELSVKEKEKTTSFVVKFFRFTKDESENNSKNNLENIINSIEPSTKEKQVFLSIIQVLLREVPEVKIYPNLKIENNHFEDEIDVYHFYQKLRLKYSIRFILIFLGLSNKEFLLKIKDLINNLKEEKIIDIHNKQEFTDEELGEAITPIDIITTILNQIYIKLLWVELSSFGNGKTSDPLKKLSHIKAKDEDDIKHLNEICEDPEQISRYLTPQDGKIPIALRIKKDIKKTIICNLSKFDNLYDDFSLMGRLREYPLTNRNKSYTDMNKEDLEGITTVIKSFMDNFKRTEQTKIAEISEEVNSEPKDKVKGFNPKIT